MITPEATTIILAGLALLVFGGAVGYACGYWQGCFYIIELTRTNPPLPLEKDTTHEKDSVAVHPQ